MMVVVVVVVMTTTMTMTMTMTTTTMMMTMPSTKWLLMMTDDLDNDMWMMKFSLAAGIDQHREWQTEITIMEHGRLTTSLSVLSASTPHLSPSSQTPTSTSKMAALEYSSKISISIIYFFIGNLENKALER